MLFVKQFLEPTLSSHKNTTDEKLARNSIKFTLTLAEYPKLRSIFTRGQ